MQSGNYLCISEVIVRALYLLQDEDTLRQIKLERLRKEVAIGIEAAERGELISSEDAFLEAYQHNQNTPSRG